VARVDAAELTPEAFKEKYLRPCRPVIVSNALNEWPAFKRWTPQFFAEEFGDIEVRLQGDYFYDYKAVNPKMTTTTLGEYLTEVWPRYDADAQTPPPKGVPPPNIRYQQQGGLRADIKQIFGWLSGPTKYFGYEAFRRLQDHWFAPRFLPRGGYSFPWTVFAAGQPNRRWFYDWGIYMSPKGTVTRMHTDGSRTHAVIMMISGKKRCLLVPSSASPWFSNKGSLIKQPYFRDIPDNYKAQLPVRAIECIVEAGDCIFIPKSWFHEVETTESSIMLTYNFLHGVPDLLGSLVDHLTIGWGGAAFLEGVPDSNWRGL